jgi:hypothetical protein
MRDDHGLGLGAVHGAREGIGCADELIVTARDGPDPVQEPVEETGGRTRYGVGLRPRSSKGE